MVATATVDARSAKLIKALDLAVDFDAGLGAYDRYGSTPASAILPDLRYGPVDVFVGALHSGSVHARDLGSAPAGRWIPSATSRTESSGDQAGLEEDSAGGASALVGAAGGNARAKTAAIAAVTVRGNQRLRMSIGDLALKRGEVVAHRWATATLTSSARTCQDLPRLAFPPIDAVLPAILEWRKPSRPNGRKRRSCSPVCS